MPREAIHWSVLEDTISQLQDENTASAQKILANNKPAAYLGSMTHDVPYYYRFGGTPFEHVAEVLHGSNGEDTLAPLRALAKAVVSESDEQRRLVMWSFWLGMLSHAITDSVVHPFVYYFTGNYYDQDRTTRRVARTKHRLLETYLDIWMRQKTPGLALKVSSSLNEMGRFCDDIFGLLDQHLGILVDGEKPKAGTWQAGFRHFALLQGMFTSDPWGLASRGLNALSGGRLKQYQVLFLQGRSQNFDLFNEQMTYANPVSGIEKSASVVDLCQTSIQQSVSLFRTLEPLLSGTTENVEEVFSVITPMSLNFGPHLVSTDKAKYFSRQGLPLPILNLDG